MNPVLYSTNSSCIKSESRLYLRLICEGNLHFVKEEEEEEDFG